MDLVGIKSMKEKEQTNINKIKKIHNEQQKHISKDYEYEIILNVKDVLINA